MSQPVSYNPSHLFVNDEATQSWFPGQAIDVELAAIKKTLDQLITNLGYVQADDLTLKNGTISYWQTGKFYVATQAVVLSGTLYVCQQAHTSTGFTLDLQQGKWLKITDLASLPLPANLFLFTQAGTGAVVRTGQDKLQEFVSVKDFGAKGDGITDDTTAIQNAINSLPLDGGTVLFPVGNYLVSSPITIGNGSSSAVSTRRGVFLVGQANPLWDPVVGTGYGNPIGPRLTRTGVNSGPMISVLGPLQGWGIQNLYLDCGGFAISGVKVISAQYGQSSNLMILNAAGFAIDSTTVATFAPAAGNTDSLHNVWDNLRIYVPAGIANTGAIRLSGTTSSNTDYNIFSNAVISLPQVNGTVSYGVYLGACDSNEFHNLHLSGGANLTVSVTFDYTINNVWPASNKFFGVDVGTLGTPWQNVGSPNAAQNYVYGLVETNGGTMPNIANVNATLAMPTGSAISWNLGNVKITHSANALAFTGGTSGYSFDVGGNNPLKIVQSGSYSEILFKTGLGITGGLTADDAMYFDSPFGFISRVGGSSICRVDSAGINLFNTKNLLPDTSGGSALGSTTKMFSSLFLATGGVINWNNGDVTATHSADALAFAGAANGYSFDSGANNTFFVKNTGGYNQLQFKSGLTITGGLTADDAMIFDSAFGYYMKAGGNIIVAVDSSGLHLQNNRDLIADTSAGSKIGGSANRFYAAFLGGNTVTASTPVLDMAQTWNNAAVLFTGIFANFTKTAGLANCLVMDLRVGNTTQFKVDDTQTAYCGTIGNLDNSSWAITGTAVELRSDKLITWALTNWWGTADLGIARNAAGVLEINNGVAGTLRDLTLRSAQLGAGTTAIAPLNFTSGTNLTSAAAGAMEYDGTCFYDTAVASARQVVVSEQVQNISGTRTFTNNTNPQAIFNGSANGAVTLAGNTTYEFEMVVAATGFSGSAHTLNLGFALGGSLTSMAYYYEAQTGSTLAGPTASASGFVATNTATAICASTTTTGLTLYVTGTIRSNATGTFTPQLTQVTASAAAVVQANSFFRCWPIGSGSVQTVGNWS